MEKETYNLNEMMLSGIDFIIINIDKSEVLKKDTSKAFGILR